MPPPHPMSPERAGIQALLSRHFAGDAVDSAGVRVDGPTRIGRYSRIYRAQVPGLPTPLAVKCLLDPATGGPDHSSARDQFDVLGRVHRAMAETDRALRVPKPYLLDEDNVATSRINAQMVEIGRVEDPQEANELKTLIEKHVAATGSEHAKGILAAWPTKLPKFVRVIPKDYKRVLACLKRAHDQGLSGDEAIMAAFEENARDTSRVGGN